MASPIVVMGVSGSGKSTVGAALAQRLRVPHRLRAPPLPRAPRRPMPPLIRPPSPPMALRLPNRPSNNGTFRHA